MKKTKDGKKREYMVNERTAFCWQSSGINFRSSAFSPQPSAFSLIEVTLALMVVSVGILAVLGLFPMGLDQNTRAIADTHMALFADEVLNGLRACAETNWDNLGGVILPVSGDTAWTNSGTGELDPEFSINMLTNIYYTSNSIADHVLRFRLALTTNGNIKAATLWVWSGEFGTTSAPAMFYAEFFRNIPQ